MRLKVRTTVTAASAAMVASALLAVPQGAQAGGADFRFTEYVQTAMTETGPMTYAYLDFDENPPWNQMVFPNPLDDDSPEGWYLGAGTTSIPIAWHASTAASPSSPTACQSSFILDGRETYTGPLLSPTPATMPGPVTSPWLDLFPSGWHGHDTVLDGPVLADVLKRPHTGTAQIGLDCGELGAATWSGSLYVLPLPDLDRETGVSINDGDDYVNSPNVSLYTGWADIIGKSVRPLVDRIKVSNDGGFAPSKTKILPVNGSGPVKWTLVQLGNERIPRTVYVRFHVVWSGWDRQVYSDDILLDTTDPTIQSVTVTGPTRAKPTIPAKASRVATIKARDDKSGIESVQISVGKQSKKARIYPYKKRVRFNGNGTVYVRVRDGAGNWSAWRAA